MFSGLLYFGVVVIWLLFAVPLMLVLCCVCVWLTFVCCGLVVCGYCLWLVDARLVSCCFCGILWIWAFVVCWC